MKYLLPLFVLLLTITCKKTPEPEAPKEKEFVVPIKNFLSKEWVSYKQTILAGANTSDSMEQELISKANSKMQKGIQFYKAKKDLDAIREYEEAIELYPSANTYYHYGNSLANLNRLEDSVSAYKIALSNFNSYRDGLDRPELVMYNIACSHSRLNQLDEAYTYLAEAVDRGYNAFAYVEKDPDMENLRKQSDWKEKIRKWRKEYNYDENIVAGLVKEYKARSALLYYLCKNRIAILQLKNYCSGYGNGEIGYQRGNWELVNGDIKINIQEACFPAYKISEKEKEKYDFEHQGAAYYCIPGIPEFHGNCASNNGNPHHSFLIRREIVKDIIKKPVLNNEQRDYNRFSLARLTEKREPKQCDPDFVPKTLEDITIREIQ